LQKKKETRKGEGEENMSSFLGAKNNGRERRSGCSGGEWR